MIKNVSNVPRKENNKFKDNTLFINKKLKNFLKLLVYALYLLYYVQVILFL